MSYKIVIHPRAEKELNEAHLYYERESEGLGNRLFTEVDEMFSHLCLSPEMYSKKKGNFRTTNLSIFPYQIIYEVFKRQKIVLILSVFHQKRNPKKKFRRG